MGKINKYQNIQLIVSGQTTVVREILPQSFISWMCLEGVNMYRTRLHRHTGG